MNERREDGVCVGIKASCLGIQETPFSFVFLPFLFFSSVLLGGGEGGREGGRFSSVVQR